MVIFLETDGSLRFRFDEYYDTGTYRQEYYSELPNVFYTYLLVSKSLINNTSALSKLKAKAVYIELMNGGISVYIGGRHNRSKVFLQILQTSNTNAAALTQEQVNTTFTRFIDYLTPYKTVGEFYKTQDTTRSVIDLIPQLA